MTTKSNFKDWIINEFPMLFYGFHNWFQLRIRHKSYLTHANLPHNIEKSGKIYDLSNFMNSLIAWYLLQVLPTCFSAHLSSESGSILEKLKNCLIVKITIDI